MFLDYHSGPNFLLFLFVVTMASNQPKEESQEEKLQGFGDYLSKLGSGMYHICMSELTMIVLPLAGQEEM